MTKAMAQMPPTTSSAMTTALSHAKDDPPPEIGTSKVTVAAALSKMPT